MAKIGNVEYPTLGAAIAALTGGETIKLLADYTVGTTEAIKFDKNATLDLNGFTVQVPDANLGKVSKPAPFAVLEGAELTLTNSKPATGKIDLGYDLASGGGSGYGIEVLGTINVACTITRKGNSSTILDCWPGAVVNAGELAVLESAGDVFRSKCADEVKDSPKTLTFNITGGTYTSRTAPESGYSMFYFMKPNYTFNLNITGGTFNTGDNLINFGACANQANATPLTDACKAKFSSVALANDVSNFALIAPGYEAVKGDDDWYTIQEIPSYTVAAISVENATVEATNKTAKTVLALPATVLRDTEIAVTVTPDTGYEYKTTPAGWTKNENGSITTNATVTADLAITVEAPTAAAAPWPVIPEFPADADDEVKDKYAKWAKDHNVTDPAGNSDAFLMNVDPTGDVPELEIKGIEVEGTTATITVGTDTTDFDLGKVNGVLYVESTDELAGEWTIKEYDLPTGDVGETATFTVTTGKFMRAKVGFKAPPVAKEGE